MEVNMDVSEFFVYLFGILLTAAFGWQWLRTSSLEKDFQHFRENTYRKSETIEHIILRTDPLNNKMDEVAKDIREIKNYILGGTK
jgi:hypothetical protein